MARVGCKLIILVVSVFLCNLSFVYAQSESANSNPASQNNQSVVEEDNIPHAPAPETVTKRFHYNPHGARDPFVPLVGAEDPNNLVRPPGLPGMQISELALQGIQIGLGKVALVVGSDDKMYTMRVGDRVFDGKLVEITNNKIVFEKIIYDAFGREKEKKKIEIYLHRK